MIVESFFLGGGSDITPASEGKTSLSECEIVLTSVSSHFCPGALLSQGGQNAWLNSAGKSEICFVSVSQQPRLLPHMNLRMGGELGVGGQYSSE